MPATLDFPTRNAAFGFYGTIETAGLDAERAWDAAFEAIADETGADDDAFGPEGIRGFLDSRLGRHFADAVVDGTMSGLDLTASIDRATERHMTWKVGRATERSEGIPARLPFLTGWIQHFAMIAEEDAAA